MATSSDSPAVLTTTSWSPCTELTAAEWVSQGRWLGAVGRGCGWWIGDWLRYGNARYGERYGPAARVTGYDVQTLMNMAYVAGRFDTSRRRDRLSFSHHAELAGVPAQEQDLWLDRAEAGALSVRSLRSELRQTRHRVAARAALAVARQERPPGTGRALEPPSFASPSVIGLDTLETPGSGPEHEVVCPECGHRFAAADGPRPRLSLAHPG
jgi:hypothetical protein